MLYVQQKLLITPQEQHTKLQILCAKQNFSYCLIIGLQKYTFELQKYKKIHTFANKTCTKR